MHADWPKLLRLYSRLKPGTTVFEWMQEHDVRDMGIDVRRFTSFGVIKVIIDRIIELCFSLTIAAGFPPPSPPVAHTPRRRSPEIQRRSLTRPTVSLRPSTIHKPLRLTTPPHSHACLPFWHSPHATSSIRRILCYSPSLRQSDSSSLQLHDINEHRPSTAPIRTEKI